MSEPEISILLDRARDGDDGARDQLLSSLYSELHKLASGYLRNERVGHTLGATALVNEVCVRMLAAEGLPGKNRIQFRAFVAKAMRHVLIDHAREKGRLKRGGGRQRVPLDGEVVIQKEPDIDLLALDEAIERLAEIEERKARVVELRYFGGLSIDEAAEHLEVSPVTVKRDWEVARTWLETELRKGDSGRPAEE